MSDITKTYAIVTEPSIISVSEGSTINYTIRTAGVDNGTRLYWTTLGNTTIADFVDNVNTGYVIINSSVGSITRQVLADRVTDGIKSITIEIRTDSTAGPIVATSAPITIQDTSTTPASTNPTYSVDTIPTSTTIIGENTIANLGVRTTYVADRTTLYWTNVGTATGSDFINGMNNGSFIINSNYGTFQLLMSEDRLTEGNKTIHLQIHTESVAGPLVATLGPITLLDTSTTPIEITPTYTLTTSPPGIASVDEGVEMSFALSTTGVADGTTLYWNNVGLSTADDFETSLDSGLFTITSNVGYVVVSIANDQIIEGTDTIVIRVHTNSLNGDVVATSSPVKINDSGTGIIGVPTYSIRADRTTVTRGETVVAYVTTQNIADGTTLYWGTSGTATTSDFADNVLNGMCLIYSNVAVIVRQTSLNLYPGESVDFTLNLYLTQMRNVAHTEKITVYSAKSIALINYGLRNITTGEYFYTPNLSEVNGMIAAGLWLRAGMPFFLLQGPNELNSLTPDIPG